MTRFKFKPKAFEPLMAQFPKDWMTQMFHFNIMEVNYAGPILIRDRKGHNFKLLKTSPSYQLINTTEKLEFPTAITKYLDSTFYSQPKFSQSRRFIIHNNLYG